MWSAWKTINWRRVLWLALLISAGMVLLLVIFGDRIYECTEATQHQQRECAYKNALLLILREVGEYGSALSAISSLIVAIFSATLWLTTRKMWSAADRQATNTEQATKLSLRAYLGPRDIAGWFGEGADFIAGDVGQVFRAGIDVVNFGKTPALDVVFIFDVFPAIFGPGVTFILAEEGPATSRAVIYPGQSYKAKSLPKFIDANMRQLLWAGSAAVYIHGVVRYTDIFGDRHETGFRSAKFDNMNGVDVIACPEGNYAT